MSANVRLKARHLEKLMEEQKLSPQQLHLVVGNPTRRGISRWLREGRRTPDGCVSTRWVHVEAVAAALGVSPGTLVDGPLPESAGGYERTLRLAAALGPTVFPALLETIATRLSMAVAIESLGSYTEPSGSLAGTEVWRFRRWSTCQAILDDHTALPPAVVGLALSWCAEHGIGEELAPALHTLCAIQAGTSDVGARVDAGGIPARLVCAGALGWRPAP